MPNPLIAPAKPAPYPNFGPDLTYAQAVKSATALRKGIDNAPPVEVYKNMVLTYQHIIKPIFAQFGVLPISSFYRSPALNRAIGGAKNSQHTTGQAVDIDCDGSGVLTNLELYRWVREKLLFDQCIKEFINPVTGQPSWVHISWAGLDKNRGIAYTAVKQNGRTIYVPA